MVAKGTTTKSLTNVIGTNPKLFRSCVLVYAFKLPTVSLQNTPGVLTVDWLVNNHVIDVCQCPHIYTHDQSKFKV